MKFGNFEIGSDALFVILVLIILVTINCQSISQGISAIISSF